MQDENFKNLFDILTKSLDNNNFKEDNIQIEYALNSLKNMQRGLPSLDELEKTEQVMKYLEIRYDFFNELSYYSDSLFAKIRHDIHNEKVKKIREENKKKRGKI